MLIKIIIKVQEKDESSFLQKQNLITNYNYTKDNPTISNYMSIKKHVKSLILTIRFEKSGDPCTYKKHVKSLILVKVFQFSRNLFFVFPVKSNLVKPRKKNYKIDISILILLIYQ